MCERDSWHSASTSLLYAFLECHGWETKNCYFRDSFTASLRDANLIPRLRCRTQNVEGRCEAVLPQPGAFRCFQPARTVMDMSASSLQLWGCWGTAAEAMPDSAAQCLVTGSQTSRSCSSSQMWRVTLEAVTLASTMTGGLLDHSYSGIFLPWFQGRPPDCHFPGCGRGGSCRGKLFRGVLGSHS